LGSLLRSRAVGTNDGAAFARDAAPTVPVSGTVALVTAGPSVVRRAVMCEAASAAGTMKGGAALDGGLNVGGDAAVDCGVGTAAVDAASFLRARQ
jgi:hypothetical protein